MFVYIFLTYIYVANVSSSLKYYPSMSDKCPPGMYIPVSGRNHEQTCCPMLYANITISKGEQIKQYILERKDTYT